MLINPYRYAAAGGFAGLAWYKAENNANDETGNYNATAGANVSYATGNDGQAFDFVGTGGTSADRVTVPTINIGNTYTFDFWIFADASQGFAHLISNAYTAASYGALYLNALKLEYWQGGAQKLVQAGAALSISTWYNIKMTYDNNKTRFYIGGSLNATEAGTHTQTAYNGQIGLGFGMIADSAVFNGRMDDPKIYNSVV